VCFLRFSLLSQANDFGGGFSFGRTSDQMSAPLCFLQQLLLIGGHGIGTETVESRPVAPHRRSRSLTAQRMPSRSRGTPSRCPSDKFGIFQSHYFYSDFFCISGVPLESQCEVEDDARISYFQFCFGVSLYPCLIAGPAIRYCGCHIVGCRKPVNKKREIYFGKNRVI